MYCNKIIEISIVCAHTVPHSYSNIDMIYNKCTKRTIDMGNKVALKLVQKTEMYVKLNFCTFTETV